MNSVVDADSIRGRVLTPTQALAIKRHADFVRGIAEKAALLAPPLPPAVPHAPEPDPPAPEPPRMVERYSFKETWFSIAEVSVCRKLSARQIKEMVCSHFNVEYIDLVSAGRLKFIIIPRQIAMFLCKELTDMSYPHIGRAFGGKDHSTIHHACTKIRSLLLTNENISNDVSEIRRRLGELL